MPTLNMPDPRVSQGLGVLAALIVVIVSWQQAYQPAVGRHQHGREQMAALTEQLAQVEAMVLTAGGEVAWLKEHRERLAQLRARIPPADQLPQLLDTLVEALSGGGIELIDVQQGNLEPVNTGGTPLLIDGMPCLRLPVTVTAAGRYHDVIVTLSRLTDEAFPSLVGIEHMELRRKGSTDPTLDATVRLAVYILGRQRPAPPDA